MKLPWTITALAGVCLLVASTFANAAPDIVTKPSPVRVTPLSNEEIRERLEKIELPFDARITPAVKEYIKRYTVNGYKDSEFILGRTTLYFPIFEHYLSIYQLPKSLKYLPIVESALKTGVRSGAGAVGLWQFVPIAARHFNLEVSSEVDERLDPYRSTEAAVKMLDLLYRELGDWPLALAAYNCGLSRVQKAMKLASCDNYWDIQEYLPHDTRRYVPAFIAAAYLGNYYQEHGLNPQYPDEELQDTRVFKVYTRLSFYKLSKTIGLPVSLISSLNPGFLSKYIPYNRKGHFLKVPTIHATAVRGYLDELQKLETGTPQGYFETFYTVTPGDRIETLAALFECEKEELLKWNGIFHSDIVVNQHLRIFLPKTRKKA